MMFWFLIVLTAFVAIAIIVRPLFRQEDLPIPDEDQLRISIYRENLNELDQEYGRGQLDEDQLANVRHELELSLLQEVSRITGQGSDSLKVATNYNSLAAIVFGMLILTGTFSLYHVIGNPQLNALKDFSHVLANFEEGEPPPLREVVVLLERHLEKNPEDTNGWMLLSNIYMSIAEYDKAIDAYDWLYQLVGDNPGLLLQYVNVLVRVNDGSFQGKATELLQRILRVDPGNHTALFYSGLAADEAGNYKLAIDYYSKILPVLQNNPELLQTVRFLIARNEQLILLTQPDAREASGDMIDPSISIALHISVAEDFKGKFAPGDTLFVYAQALEGSPMPLAVVRSQARDLPLDIILDDSMAMTPALKLSGFDKVRLQARISKSGNAQPESGDLTGMVSEIDVADPGTVNLVIDTILP